MCRVNILCTSKFKIVDTASMMPAELNGSQEYRVNQCWANSKDA